MCCRMVTGGTTQAVSGASPACGNGRVEISSRQWSQRWAANAQAPNNARSSSLMPVALFKGMAR
ncbi:hypothetical protein NBRC116584_00640 [Hydrogenophaga sp. 5NK40-0174]